MIGDERIQEGILLCTVPRYADAVCAVCAVALYVLRVLYVLL